MVLVLLLTLHYARSTTNVCGEAAYGSVARVTCPAGSIITEVLYAAFSTAITGSCATGSPYKGVAINLGYNCDTAVNAFGMVQGACLFNNSCSLLASRSEFSFQSAPKDCSSSAPRLAINVTCSPRAFSVPLPAVVTICGSARDSSSIQPPTPSHTQPCTQTQAQASERRSKDDFTVDHVAMYVINANGMMTCATHANLDY